MTDISFRRLQVHQVAKQALEVALANRSHWRGLPGEVGPQYAFEHRSRPEHRQQRPVPPHPRRRVGRTGLVPHGPDQLVHGVDRTRAAADRTARRGPDRTEDRKSVV